jgi:AcrR family transcriptional regulator
MPRAPGQIDTRKHEAILDAAVEVLAERGVHAPIEEVARRAGVSKQTVYNHYGSKTELVRTIMARRRSALTAVLELAGPDDDPLDTLTVYAKSILEVIMTTASISMMRMGVTSATEMPEMSHAIYDAGSRAARIRLASYLTNRAADLLEIDNPAQAAEMFVGMVIGGVQMRLLMGLPSELDGADLTARAQEAARRFIKAYARNGGAG